MQRFLRQSTAVDVLIGPFIDDTDFKTPETALTITNSDTQLSKNGQALANRSDVTSCAHDASGFYNCELDATDTNTVGQLRITVNESGALPMWEDFFVMQAAAYDRLVSSTDAATETQNTNIKLDTDAILLDTGTTLPAQITALNNFNPASDDVAVVTLVNTTTTNTDMRGTDSALTDKAGFSLSATGLDLVLVTSTFVAALIKGVWDRVLTGATHNINNSAGKRLRQASAIVFNDGTAQSGGNNTIQLASGAIPTNDIFRRAKVILIGGTGAGQEGIITSTVASTDTCTVTPAWITNPDATTEYEILPGQTHSTVRNGGYDNAMVYIDTIGGTSGTQKGVQGTTTRPSDNITDSLAIAVAENLNQFDIANESDITLAADTKGVSMMGVVWVLRLGGQDISGSNFVGAQISGTGTKTGFIPIILDKCAISGTCSMPAFVGDNCTFSGTLTMLAASDYTLTNSNGAGSASSIAVAIFASTTSLNLRAFNGDVEIQSMVTGNNMAIDGEGKLDIDGSCTGGAITVRGDIEIIGGAAFITAGGTINDTANISEIDAKIASGLSDIHLDHLFAVDYDPASKPGVATALLNELIVSDAGVSQYSTNALENGPSGGDATEAKQDTILANLATVDTVVDAVKAKTDNLPSDPASETNVDANETKIDTLTTNLSTVDTVVDAIKVKTDNLPGAIPKGVALANFAFLLVDATDFATPETGRTVTATISKDGAAFGAMTNSVTEISNGMYKITVTASEMTADIIILRFAASGAADRFVTIKTDA